MNFIAGVFKPPCNVSISFADGRSRKQGPIKKDNGQTVMVPLFQSQENIVGEVSLIIVLSNLMKGHSKRVFAYYIQLQA
jgi:hypothetical protein